MKTAVFAYSRRGCALARRVLAALGEGGRAYTLPRFGEPGFGEIPQPSGPFYGELFSSMDALIFVGAAGIAVRSIAPFVRSKATDPAVLSLDEGGFFVIPLLSGHIGGGNALARRLAEALGAQAAVTTATDVNARFSVDAWATEQGYVIDDLKAAKAVSAAILEGDVPFCSDLPIVGDLAPGLALGESGPVGIFLGWRKREPFDVTLRLVPRCLRLGLGCRRGTPKTRVAEAVSQVLDENGIDPRAVRCASSIDLKRDEAGLLEYCREMGLPISFHSAGELNNLPGDFTPSAFVQSVAGVDNVCERAALLGGGRLIVRKTAIGGVTVALAAENREVRFG